MFDNIGTSLMTIHQLITTDSWSSYIYNLMDIDIPLIGGIYGLIVLVFGDFIVMNLILAVIIDTFIKLHDEELKKESIDEGAPIEIVVPDEEINVEYFNH